MVVLVAVVAGIVSVIVPPFIARLAELGSSISEGAQQVAYTVGRGVGMTHGQVDRALARAATNLRQHLTGIAGEAVTGATAVAAVLGGAAFVPIVGAITAGVAAVLVALVAKGLGAALIVLAAIVAVQQIEGNVLYPVVVGPRLRLHPIVVLLAVAAGGTIAGLPGAFLAVPVATVCAAVLDHVREPDAEEPGPAG